MLSALPQNMEYSSIMMFLFCHAPKSKSLWMVRSSNIVVCSAALSGGIAVIFSKNLNGSKLPKTAL
jgi:hypothetical protein